MSIFTSIALPFSFKFVTGTKFFIKHHLLKNLILSLMEKEKHGLLLDNFAQAHAF